MEHNYQLNLTYILNYISMTYRLYYKFLFRYNLMDMMLAYMFQLYTILHNW